MGHADHADELLEVLGDELRAVVADDARAGVGEAFAGALQDGFHVDFLHLVADFPVDEEAAVAVEDRAQEVERAGDIEVADIDMPLLMRLEGLHEAGALAGDVGGVPGQESRLLENAVDAGRAARNDIGIEHHESQAAIALAGVLLGERADAGDLVFGEPMIAWHPGVVLVDLTEALSPVLVLAAADTDPGHKAGDREFGLIGPGADEVDDPIAGVVGDQAALQRSPFLFFSSVRASMSSAMTSFFFWSLAS